MDRWWLPTRARLSKALTLLAVPSLWFALCCLRIEPGGCGSSALSRVPVSQAYPLLSVGYVLNIGLAWWLFGEVPNAQRVIGVGVIIVGVRARGVGQRAAGSRANIPLRACSEQAG